MRLPKEAPQVMQLVYTPSMIKKALKYKEWVLWAVTTMNVLQQPEERKAKTCFIADGVGPSKFDAFPITTTVQLLEEGEELSDALVDDMRKRMNRYAYQLSNMANQREIQRAWEAVGHLEAGQALIREYVKRVELENPLPKKKDYGKHERNFSKMMQTDIKLLESNLRWGKEFLQHHLDGCKICGDKATLSYGKCYACRKAEAEAKEQETEANTVIEEMKALENEFEEDVVTGDSDFKIVKTEIGKS